MSEWKPIESAPAGKYVLVYYENAAKRGRTIIAKFTPRFTVESHSDGCGDDADEYDEANDRYTYREGWWERVDNWDDFSCVYVNEGVPIYWMPLPEPPK